MASIFRTGQRLWLFVQGTRVAVRAKSHDHDSITVSPGPNVLLPRGAEVPVGCPTPYGYMIYWMQVMTPPNDLGRQAVLRRNPNAAGNFNRRGWRVNVSLPATIRRAGAPHFIESRAANLSMEGAFLESAASISLGDLIDVRMTIPGTTPCQLSARVCRLAAPTPTDTDNLSPDQPVTGAGLCFLNVPPETRTILTCYLWRTIRESRGVGSRIPHDSPRHSPA